MKYWEDKENMLCVTIYADTTGQYTDEEIEAFESEFWGQMLDIPVPEDLLFCWWMDDQINNKVHWGTHAWESADYEEFKRWFHEESTADDTDTLYKWLVAHNYYWKRLD